MTYVKEKDLFVERFGGYAQYRIPCVAVTKSGTVMVCCEARKTCDDWAMIDIYIRRSTDGAHTFTPREKLVDGVARKVTVNNPVLIAGQGKTLHFLYCENYARAFHRVSHDDGKTWSAPREITGVFEAFRPLCPWKVIATGPCHGIQLKNGRLVVPVWISDASKWAHGPSMVATIYSDDDGVTWQAGEIVPQSQDVYSPNETSILQLKDGSVLLNIRTHNVKNQDLSTHRRAFSVSRSGADGWSVPVLQEALHDPSCCGGIARANGPVYLSGLNCDLDRQNLTIWVGGDKCEFFPLQKTLCRGGAGYSDLAVLPDGTLLCFYEYFWGRLRYHSLRLARISPEWFNVPSIRETAAISA